MQNACFSLIDRLSFVSTAYYNPRVRLVIFDKSTYNVHFCTQYNIHRFIYSSFFYSVIVYTL